MKEIKIKKTTLIVFIIVVVAVIAGAVVLGLNIGKKSAGQKKSAKGKENSKVEETATDNVLGGAYVTVKKNVIFFGYENMLCSALIDKDGQIYDVVREATTAQAPKAMTIDGNNLFVNMAEGICCVNLKELDSGKQITKDVAYDGFYILKDYIYYIEGSAVKRVPSQGGAAQEIIPKADDFAVTDKGIYYISGNGKLYCADLSGDNIEAVAECGEVTSAETYGDDIYLKGEGIKVYNVKSKKIKDIPVTEKLKEESDLLITKEYLLYESDSGETYQYDFDKKKDTHISYVPKPGSLYSAEYGGHLYYTYGSGTLCGIDLNTFEVQNVDIADAFAQSDSGDAGTFDIGSNLVKKTSEGTAFVQSDYFYLGFNYEDFSNGLWGIEQKNADSIAFYYTKAREKGLGGIVFQITAYDLDDDSYSELPSYAVAGTDNEKRYIISYPTDVQFDPESGEQQEEYGRMAEYAKRINENNKNGSNPFSTSR